MGSEMCIRDRLLPAEVCAPESNMPWRLHYLDFGRTWMLRAKEVGRAVFTIHDHVYDATEYLHWHPGSSEFLLAAAGTDATELFELAGHSQNARRILKRFATPHLDPIQPSLLVHGTRLVRSAHRGSEQLSPCGVLPAQGKCSAIRISSPPTTPKKLNPSLCWCFSNRMQAQRAHLVAAQEQSPSIMLLLWYLFFDPAGRRQLVHLLGKLLSAGFADLERSGREPFTGLPYSNASPAGNDMGLVMPTETSCPRASSHAPAPRFFPLAWRMASSEIRVAYHLRRRQVRRQQSRVSGT